VRILSISTPLGICLTKSLTHSPSDAPTTYDWCGLIQPLSAAISASAQIHTVAELARAHAPGASTRQQCSLGCAATPLLCQLRAATPLLVGCVWPRQHCSLGCAATPLLVGCVWPRQHCSLGCAATPSLVGCVWPRLQCCSVLQSIRTQAGV
jgi:hypothetical protein